MKKATEAVAMPVAAASGKHVGPPRRLVGGTRKNVYLDTASIAEAIKLGGGDMSAGIREALRLSAAASGRAGAKQKGREG